MMQKMLKKLLPSKQAKAVPTAPQTLSDDYLMVAAIDFGTTYSGYAFSYKRAQTDIKMNTNWGAGQGCSSYKTPTCVLLSPQGEFMAFGYEAQHQYESLLGEQDHTHMLFERFKMKLHNNKHLNETTQIEATNGRKMPALQIFSMALEYLKGHMMAQISKTIADEVMEDLIRWVLTVPAIWSDAAKQFMREAAKNAGLIKDIDSGHLVIALEPEAASTYCRSLSVSEFVERSQKGSEIGMKTRSKYLVIDAGGGTLDVTAHEIQADGTMKELHYATGGPLGGIRVDKEFTELMRNVFGEDFINDYMEKSSSQWMQIINDFEKKKRAIVPGRTTNLHLMYDFCTKYKAAKGQDVESVFKKCMEPELKFTNGQMCLSYDRMQRLFDPVLCGIESHVKELTKLPKLSGVRYFFLVGGFGECSLVQQVIFDHFGDVEVLVPNEASLAILKGAVAFGHNPKIISSRVAARTYGIRTNVDFEKGFHDKGMKVVRNGKAEVLNAFRPFVTKGQDITIGYTKKISFSPTKPEQDTAFSGVYTTEKELVRLATEEGVEHHADIKVPWPGSGLDRSIEISMTFGGTEVTVDAISYPGKEHQSCTVNFYAQ